MPTGERVTVTTYGCAEHLCRLGLLPGRLEYIDVTPKPKRITVRDTQLAVCDWYGIAMLDLRSARRAREIARPRQVGMYLARQLTLNSLPEIGRIYGNRDHTTVIHAIRQIEKLRQIDDDLNADVEAISESLAA